MPSFIFEKSNHPELIVLNTNHLYYQFYRVAHSLGVGFSDVNEIIWQIFDLLYTPDDQKTLSVLERLPDYSRLVCKQLLEDWPKEKAFKEAVSAFALGLHLIVKHLGMYHHDTEHELGFPYTYYKLENGMIVLKALHS